MRSIFLSFAVVLLATGTPALAAHHHHDDHHDHGAAAELRLAPDGRKWPTDAALRRNMAAIRADLTASRRGQEGRAGLGKAIEARIADIVVQCRLEPQADAMLHLVVSRLLEAADALQGKGGGNPTRAVGAAKAALNDYGRYFDDPGWKPID